MKLGIRASRIRVNHGAGRGKPATLPAQRSGGSSKADELSVSTLPAETEFGET